MNMNMIKLEEKKVLIRPSQAEMTKGKEVVIGQERPPRMIKPKSPKDDQWQKNEVGKPQRRPKATFDILLAKYKEGRADIRGRENRTIRNPKSDSLISLSQASTSAAESSSDKRSRTPQQQQHSEGRGCRHQDYHPVPHFLVGPPMLVPWGAPPMMFPLCRPWAGWYGPWVPPPMHFHPGWLGPAQGFGHGYYYTGDGCYRHIGHQQGKEASGQENRTVRNAKSDHPIS
jgi:hypothetical protein